MTMSQNARTINTALVNPKADVLNYDLYDELQRRDNISDTVSKIEHDAEAFHDE